MSKLEIKGCLMSMGGDLPRLTIQCADGTLVELSNVDPALLAGMPMLLYKRVRLVVEAEDQPAPAAAPEGERQQVFSGGIFGCTPQPQEFGPVPDPSSDPVAEGFRRKAERGHVTCPGSATEGDLLALQQWMLAWKSGDSHPGFEEWRAAYLERWKDAPEWAQWLSQDEDGWCDFWVRRPVLFANREWLPGSGEPRHTDRQAADNLLGSVRCEPRPAALRGEA